MVTPRERQLLQFSSAVAFLTGVAGIIFGLFIHSQVIMLNGFCLMVHGAMTAVAAAVSRLVSQAGSGRFQYRYWHLEPVIAASNGLVFSLVGALAFIEAVRISLVGGQIVNFALGAYYALTASIISLVMCLFTRRHALQLDSGLLRIGHYTWLLCGVFGGVIAVAFLGFSLLSRSATATGANYADPSVLAICGVILVILPIGSVVQAVRDITRVTPSDIDAEVCNVMDGIISQRDLLTYSCHVAKAGRAHFIEIHIITRPDFAQGCIKELDRIRENIEDRLGKPGTPRWLTITFTARPEQI